MQLFMKPIKLKKLNFRLTYEGCFMVLLGMVWTNMTLLSYFKAMLLRIPFTKDNVDFLVSCIFAVLAVLSVPYMKKRVSPALLLTYFGICIVYLLNFVLFPQNQEALEFYLVKFLLECLPLIFVGVSIDLKKHYKMLYVLSVLSVIVRSVHHIIIEPLNVLGGDMNSAYLLLPHICMVVFAMLNKRTFINVSVSILGTITIFAYGTRGPFLCMAVLVLAYMLVYNKFYKRPGVFVMVAGAAVGLAFWSKKIMVFLADLTEKLGTSTRILDMIMAGNAFWESGRDVIREKLLRAISENWFGYGIAGDKALVGTYSHNILIEFWVSYGVFIGTLLLGIALFFLLRLMFLKSKDSCVEDGLIYVLMSSTLVKLSISGTYLQEPFLFLLIGVVVAEYRKLSAEKKRKHLEVDEDVVIDENVLSDNAVV